jgi:hypothetical protein
METKGFKQAPELQFVSSDFVKIPFSVGYAFGNCLCGMLFKRRWSTAITIQAS